jgi:hypothetical protein
LFHEVFFHLASVTLIGVMLPNDYGRLAGYDGQMGNDESQHQPTAKSGKTEVNSIQRI